MKNFRYATEKLHERMKYENIKGKLKISIRIIKRLWSSVICNQLMLHWINIVEQQTLNYWLFDWLAKHDEIFEGQTIIVHLWSRKKHYLTSIFNNNHKLFLKTIFVKFFSEDTLLREGTHFHCWANIAIYLQTTGAGGLSL